METRSCYADVEASTTLSCNRHVRGFHQLAEHNRQVVEPSGWRDGLGGLPTVPGARRRYLSRTGGTVPTSNRGKTLSKQGKEHKKSYCKIVEKQTARHYIDVASGKCKWRSGYASQERAYPDERFVFAEGHERRQNALPPSRVAKRRKGLEKRNAIGVN